MFGFFEKKEESIPEEFAPNAYPTAPGTEIHYHPHLIDHLTSDHRTLLDLYGTVQKHLAAREFNAVSERLEEFREILENHLLTEKIRLYVYLEHQLTDDPERAELTREFRREMDAIGRAVMRFFRTHKDFAVNEEQLPQFKKELDGLGQVLTDRIAREEKTLYPMYAISY